MKSAFVTFVYPASEIYFSDFIESLRQQTYLNFELLIFNDGVVFPEKYLKNCPFTVKIFDVKWGAAKNREFAIKVVSRLDYDNIIFGDSDDYFSASRVEYVVRYLKKYEIVVNDVDIVSQNKEVLKKSYFSNRLENLKMINAKFILNKNIFGLSNTAVRSSCLFDFDIPEDQVAVDWFFFALLLESSFSSVFCGDATTHYRQHGNNTIGFKDTDLESYKKEVSIKYQHYSSLCQYFVKYEPLMLEYKNKIESFERDPKYLVKSYEDMLNNKKKHPFWWENC